MLWHREQSCHIAGQDDWKLSRVFGSLVLMTGCRNFFIGFVYADVDFGSIFA